MLLIINISVRKTPVNNTSRPGRGCWMKNIIKQGEIAWRGKLSELGCNDQNAQGVSFGCVLESF